jgi:hypothetical protein
MIAFLPYFLWAYVALPISWKVLYEKRYEICPLAKCWKPLAKCLFESSCRTWVDDVAQCQKPNSAAMQESAKHYQHVQHPTDPAYCQYQSFDRLQTATALDFLECVGRSGCMAPAKYSDICADMTAILTLPFDTIPTNVLKGKWRKIFTTGWDLWPCQWTIFWAPHTPDEVHPPDSWMTEWPHNSNVWRMDLYWRNAKDAFTFHMSNEMFIGKTWDFDNPTSAPATLRTRAVMWSTEAHENWYLLDFNPELGTMMIYYCAYTSAVNRFDSMAMVLQRDDSPPLTREQAGYYEQLSKDLLGRYHGNLKRIKPCS